MEIGRKIKNARAAAGLTQEQAAEALGVSRQTISNWENGKTWPDIVSVVKMSDLYDISLDCLLKDEKKEEKPVSDYVSYLAESADAAAGRARLAKTVLICVYLGIWALSLIVFWLFTDGSDAMGYSLMFLWLLLPVTTFVLSLIIGANDYWGRRKWLCAPVFGLMYMLAEYATFRCANMAAFGVFRLPDPLLILPGAIISLLGLVLGSAARRTKAKKDR